MRKWILLPIVALATAAITVFAPTALQAESADGSDGQASVAPELAPGTVARFRVGYMNSQTGGVPRSATVVTVVNEATVPCTVSVDWRRGFSTTGIGGVICTTTVSNLQRGQSAELCSRPIPGAVAVCNATCSPALTFDEGNAVVGSTSGAACAKISVSTRTYYFGASDSDIVGITDPSITKFAVGTVGD